MKLPKWQSIEVDKNHISCKLSDIPEWVVSAKENSAVQFGIYDMSNGVFVRIENLELKIGIRTLGDTRFINQKDFLDRLDGSEKSQFTRKGEAEAIKCDLVNLYAIETTSNSIKFKVLSPDHNWVTFYSLQTGPINT